MKLHLGINVIYAAKRWPEPGEWGKQVVQRWGLKYVQFCFDLLDPRSSPEAPKAWRGEFARLRPSTGSKSRVPSLGWELTPTICCFTRYQSSERMRWSGAGWRRSPLRRWAPKASGDPLPRRV
jgi:hypothetical protein